MTQILGNIIDQFFCAFSSGPSARPQIQNPAHFSCGMFW